MAQALTKAPYGTLSWLYAQFDRGKTEFFSTDAVQLTPELANELLTRNAGNRSLRLYKLKTMQADIEAGNWTLNGETIIVASDGHLNDGQHRCEAVVRAGISIPVVLVFGATRASRFTVDQGAARTSSDILGLKGIPNSAGVSATVRLLAAYDKPKGENVSFANRISTAEILAKLDENPDVVQDYAYIDNMRAPFVISSHAAFALHVFKRYHNADAYQYIDDVMTGEGLHRGNPAYAVRNRLIGSTRLLRQEAVEILFRGFVAFRERRTVATIKLGNGDLPKLA